MLITNCSVCGEIIQDGEKTQSRFNTLGEFLGVAHEDCMTDIFFAERAENDKQAFFDSSRGVGI